MVSHPGFEGLDRAKQHGWALLHASGKRQWTEGLPLVEVSQTSVCEWSEVEEWKWKWSGWQVVSAGGTPLLR